MAKTSFEMMSRHYLPRSSYICKINSTVKNQMFMTPLENQQKPFQLQDQRLVFFCQLQAGTKNCWNLPPTWRIIP